MPRMRGDRAPDAGDIFVAQLAGVRLKKGAGVGLEDDLGDAIAVAQVDEEQAAEISPGVDPAVQDNLLSNVLDGQVTARMSSLQ